MRCREVGGFVAQQKVFHCAIDDAVLRTKAWWLRNGVG